MEQVHDNLDDNERAVLQLICASEPTVDIAVLKYLCCDSTVQPPGIQQLANFDFYWSLRRLRSSPHVVTNPENPTAIGVHAALREAYHRLMKESEEWRTVNGLLAEAYESRVVSHSDLPADKEPHRGRMRQILAAIRHYCLAHEFEDAYRLWQTEVVRLVDNRFYATNSLGMWRESLDTLEHFFTELKSQWELHPEFECPNRGGFFRSANVILRARLRLQDSIVCGQFALHEFEAEKDWFEAGQTAQNLNQTHIALGQLKEAVETGKDSVKWIDAATTEVKLRQHARLRLAEALHYQGELDEAAALVDEAEGLKARLKGFAVFQICDLLLTQAKVQRAHQVLDDVIRRGQRMIAAERKNPIAMRLALAHLVIGRAYMEKQQFDEAKHHLSQSLENMDKGGELQHRPLILLALAEWNLHQTDTDRSMGAVNTLLHEVDRIAADQLLLHKTDSHIMRVRYHLATGERSKAEAQWREADRLVKDLGYGRRRSELDGLGGC